jgi:hypothetical protein
MTQQKQLAQMVKTWDSKTIAATIADYKQRVADCKRDRVSHKRWSEALAILEAEVA